MMSVIQESISSTVFYLLSVMFCTVRAEFVNVYGHIAHDFMLPDQSGGKKCNVIPAITRGGRSCTRACNQLSDVTRAHRSCTYHCMARTHLVCPTMQIISSVYSQTCFPVCIIAIGNIESSNLCGQVRCWKTAPKPS